MLQNSNFKLDIDIENDGHIVEGQQNTKKTPPEGAGNTRRELTAQADLSSMEATRDPTNALSSRQLLLPANDDFFVESGRERSSRSKDTIRMIADVNASTGWLEAIQILTAVQNRRLSRGNHH